MTGRATVVLRDALGGILLCAGVAIGVVHAAPRLPWPPELPAPLQPKASIYISEKSNLVLDFHGSVQDPDLVLFMAGNQYMVLPELIETFHRWLRAQPKLAQVKADRVFYATTPPGRLIDAMDSGQLVLGNLSIDVRPGKLWPDVFMTGPRQQKRLRATKYIDSWSNYTRNRGVVLLVRAGNPKKIRGLSDLAREDVRVAISSPTREPASFESYSNTLRAQGGAPFLEALMKKKTTVSPVAVHHRENPQFIHDGVADVAPMYYHFGVYLKKHLPKEFDYVELPKEGNFLDVLAISMINNAPHRAAAQAWIEFIRSDAAAAVYQKNGFNYAPAEERARREEP